jgi:hypothetical protein
LDVVVAVPVTVLLDDSAREAAEDVLEGLTAAGMSGAVLLGQLGVVTGRIERAAIPALRSLPGVAAVETQREVRAVPSRLR